MEKHYFIKSILLFAGLLIGGVSSLWAETVIIGWGAATGDNSYNFESRNGSIDGILSYSAVQNGSTTAPSYNDSNDELRLYYHAGGNGGSITITPAGGITITGAIMTTSTTPSVNYSVDGGTATKVSASNKTYTVSNISATKSLTFQNVNTSNTQLRIVTIEITYTESLDVSLSATSNNTDYGTVTLSGNKITATPAEGYRISKTSPYTVTSGVATVVQTENEFTVSATAACTVQINFEAVPAHLITITSPSGGSIIVKNGEETITSGNSVLEGTTLTIATVPDANYKFQNWQANDDVFTDVFTYVVDETDVTISATFEETVTYKAIFSVDGANIEIANYEEGTSIIFPTDPADVGGKTFVGWAASAIAGTTDEAPSLITEATMGTEDRSYYAVFASVSSSLSEVTKIIDFEATTNSEWQITNVKRILNTNANSGSYCGSIESAHSYVVYNDKVKVKEFSFAFVRNSSNENHKVYIETSKDNETWTAVKTCKMTDFNSDGQTFTTVSQTFDGENELYVRFHCYNTTAKRYVDDVMIKYVAETSSYSSYCTTVSTTETVTIGEALYATCSSSRALDFSKSGATVYTAWFDGSMVQLAEVKDGVVPANTGVIVHAATAGDYVAEVTTAEEPLSSNDLLVSDGTVTGGETIFALASKEQGVGFYQLSASMTLRAGRVYLPIPASESRSFVGFGSETTDLGAALNNNGAMQNDNSIFTLSGQRVMKARKGLYIQGGKKMVVK